MRKPWIDLNAPEWAICVMAAHQALRIERAKGADTEREREVVKRVLTLTSGEAEGNRGFDLAFEKVFKRT